LAIQELIDKDLICAGHDISDGGLITALLEMAFAGNCGLDAFFFQTVEKVSAMDRMFAEELGLLIECEHGDIEEVFSVFEAHNLVTQACVCADTRKDDQIIITYNSSEVILDEDMKILRQEWEETSYQLDRLQCNPVCADEEKKVSYERSGPRYVVPFEPEQTASRILDATDKPKVAILREEGSNSDREMTTAFYMAGFEPWDITMSDLLAGRVDLSQFRGLAAVGGFSYADVPESAKGWAATILFNPKLKDMFGAFYERHNTFTLGICNGCQRFESRWSTATIEKSQSIMLSGMEGLTFGIHVDHGEGRLHFPNMDMIDELKELRLLPIVYVDDAGWATEKYPFNPNGSPGGLAGMCSEDGRHLAMMPHPERTFKSWQCHWLPEEMKKKYQQIGVSPWMQMFQNAYKWCTQNK